MSLFIPVQAKCPSCGHSEPVQLAASVNADRRPDLRDEILAGTFQVKACPACAAAMRMPAHMSYVDIGRRQWFLIEDIARLPEWQEAVAAAAALFDDQFGPEAPAPQRALLGGGIARLVFGWPALREKLHAADAGLDDATLELLKIAVLRRTPAPPFGDGKELRLVGATAETLSLAWLETENERFIAALEVPHDIYDGIADNPAPWAELRASVAEGLYVDMNRLVLA